MLEQKCLAQSILIRGARQLLTLRGKPGFRRGAALQELTVTEDGAVLIRDGVIAEVGLSRRVENLKESRGAIEIPAHGCVVMPGFTDNGMRAFTPLSRGKTYTRTKNNAVLLLQNCLQHGTTTVEFDTGGSEDTQDDIPLLRHAHKVGAHGDVVHSWRLRLPNGSGEEGWLARLKEHLGYLTKRYPPQFLKVEPGTASLELFRSVLQMAVTFNLRLKLVSGPELGDEFLRLVAEYGLVSVAGASLTPGGNLSTIASLPCAAVFRPLLDLKDPVQNGRTLCDYVAEGGAPVIASGNEQDRSGYSMQAAVALAVLRHGMTLEQSLVAATVNAACAAGCGHDRGSLEVGKRADILMLNISDYHDMSHHLGVNYIAMVIRRGAVVFNRTSWRATSSGG